MITMLTHTVKWSWTVNAEIPPGGGTITGTRTASGMWRTNSNTEWGSVSMVTVGYELDTTENRWSNSFWLQLGQGVDTYLFENLLGRLNMQSHDWEITYKSHPANNEVPGYSWVVDSTAGGMLACIIGWNERDMSPPTEAKWSWGLQSLIKDFTNNVLKTITIGRTAAATMSGSTFSDNTVLFQGTLDSPVGNSFNIRVLDAPRGLDATHFQVPASAEHPPGAQALTKSSKEAQLQATIAELQAKITELSTPRQEDQGRERWNSDDVGPALSDEALVGGARQLDRQGMPPSQAELGTGATRALISGQAIKPSQGAWEKGVQE